MSCISWQGAGNEERSISIESKTKISLDCCVVRQFEDGNGQDTTVMEARLYELVLSHRSSTVGLKQPTAMLSSCQAKLLVNYMDNALESLEPLLVTPSGILPCPIPKQKIAKIILENSKEK